ncbi:60S ribosomal export protein NMD3 [Aeropyrum camini]|uniref:NMD family protein n=1 Tax=Aeropyrum camini SY1 = JCM 12091 TaxID=1198449 RepID=U3THV2_9CREN|nr:60S ribosomal export protein NMD3 [Aeropyrum camini]BAN90934.1 NMD family protein [Aeropyrum camini SY1 = JCM 12091]
MRGLKSCAGCGRPSEVLLRGLCPECFDKRHGVVEGLPRELAVDVCTSCGRIRVGHRWLYYRTPEEGVGLILSSIAYKPVHPVEQVVLEGWSLETSLDWRTRVRLRLKASHQGLAFNVSRSIVLRLNPSTCPLCIVKRSGEYDTLVQVRGAAAEDTVERVLNTLDPKEAPVDVIPVRGGVDVYFHHRGAAARFVSRLGSIARVKVSRIVYEHVGTSSMGKRRSRKTIVVRLEGASQRGER